MLPDPVEAREFAAFLREAESVLSSPLPDLPAAVFAL
jgi:hypothetical protein